MPTVRKIIHIDMDAFFAAVEQRDYPEYRNKPLVVGGSPFSRGVVATCSYEARTYGIHSAMPASKAYRLCPNATFVLPRFEAYREVSQQIRKIFFDYTELVEPLSLDEAYLDVSQNGNDSTSATLIAQAIKKRIQQVTQLTASAGVSYNKFLAKMASDINKPNGLFVIKPEQGEGFVAQLPIHKFHGVGNATAKKMQALGIQNGNDLRQLSVETLQQHFGKSGLHYYNIARAIDTRPVVSFKNSQSIGVETTFQQDITSYHAAIESLLALYKKAIHKLADRKLVAYTMTVKIKYHDFVQITRSRTFSVAINYLTNIRSILEALLQNTEVGHRNVRLLGITLSSLDDETANVFNEQSDLFEFI